MIYFSGQQVYIQPLFFGWGLSFASVIIGGFVVTKALRNEGNGFINTVLLSMVVRMFVTVILIFILIYFLKIDKIGLAVIFFFYFILFLIFEVNFLSDKSKKKLIQRS